MRDGKADIWNYRNRDGGEPYKRHITDPLFLILAEPYGKVVLEQGCGNGHLAKKIAKKSPKKIILLDLYETNLDHARRNLEGVECKLEFVQADLTQPLSLDSSSVDVVTSSMVLPEIEKYRFAIKETSRILNSRGVYVFSVLHPAYVLKKFLTENPPKKIIPPRDYFDGLRSEFVFRPGTDEEMRAPHYNRTIQDYTDALFSAGFQLERILEPPLTPELLKEAPRFEEETDCPISLVIKARKIQ